MKKHLLIHAAFLLSSMASAQAADCRRLAVRLNALASADQQIRQEWQQLEHNPHASVAERDALQQRWRTIDADNLKQFKSMVAGCGWPKNRKDSHGAWLLAQHADSDLAFQRLAKGLLEASVKAGIGAPRDLAYLADRIATNEGRPQEYGTQLFIQDRCHLEFAPMDDRAMVSRRRLAIGLQSLEAYEAEGRRRLIPADCPAN